MKIPTTCIRNRIVVARQQGSSRLADRPALAVPATAAAAWGTRALRARHRARAYPRPSDRLMSGFAQLLHLPQRAVRVLVSRSTDVATNLALEDWLFRSFDAASAKCAAGPLLFLYRNAPSIVLGRNQNPWKQCRMDGLRSAGVQLARRNSGGGTVYHDLGNTNFCFMSTKDILGDKHGRLAHAELVAAALRNAFGVPAAVSQDRMDLIVSESGPAHCVGSKFSGAAFRVSGERAYYHATLLLDADVATLENLLHFGPPATDAAVVVEGKDTASVRAPYGVVNLIDLPRRAPTSEGGCADSSGQLPISHDTVITALAEHLAAVKGVPCEIVDLPVDEIMALRREDGDVEARSSTGAARSSGSSSPGILARQAWHKHGQAPAELRERLQSHDWVYGGSPPFCATFRAPPAGIAGGEVGTVGATAMSIQVKRGHITAVTLGSASPLLPEGEENAAPTADEEMSAALSGQPFSSACLFAAAATAKAAADAEATAEQAGEWMLRSAWLAHAAQCLRDVE